MSITPEMLAKAGSEHAEQSALFCWAALPEQQSLYPFFRWCLFAIPNGGLRDSDSKIAAKRGGELKAEGVKAGVSDIFLAVSRGGWHGLFIEMKVKPNKPTTEQLTFHTEVSNQNYAVAVCYSWKEAVTFITGYLNLQ